MLHTREFTVNGQKIIVRHDRETGKRYYQDLEGRYYEVYNVHIDYFSCPENYIGIDTGLGELVLFSDVENPEKVVAELKAIFWIE